MRLIPVLLVLTCLPLAAAEVSEADKRIVQTVQRMSAFDYAKASPKTQEAINRYLDATAGTDEYFMLVEKYRITSQAATLMKILTEQAGTPPAGEAVKMLLKLGRQEEVRAGLKGLAAAPAGALLESIAAVGSQESVDLVLDALRDPATPAEAGVRAVKALGLGSAGQKALLTAARAGALPAAVMDAAGAALTTSTDAAVREEAAALFKMAVKKPLPPVAELVKLPGDATKGQTVFMTYCFTCHQVAGVGIDFGPALTEIGSKLAKEAIYDAILNPSAGISFGFEGFEVKTKTGETFVGMVASDTADDLALKLPGGVIQKIGKPTLASKTPLGVSLMTPSLHTIMEESQLVDLVEYLSGLKKKN